MVGAKFEQTRAPEGNWTLRKTVKCQHIFGLLEIRKEQLFAGLSRPNSTLYFNTRLDENTLSGLYIIIIIIIITEFVRTVELGAHS